MNYVWVAIGSALGGMARYWCSGIAAHLIGESFPAGTLIVNVVGSFVIGAFAALTGPEGRLLVSPAARIFVMVGICGGFTTFSSFSFQTMTLWQDGQFMAAVLNVVASVVLCLISVWLGQAAVSLIKA
jgi:CrcB protein